MAARGRGGASRAACRHRARARRPPSCAFRGALVLGLVLAPAGPLAPALVVRLLFVHVAVAKLVVLAATSLGALWWLLGHGSGLPPGSPAYALTVTDITGARTAGIRARGSKSPPGMSARATSKVIAAARRLAALGIAAGCLAG